MSALLPERSSPELLYLETKWASLASYRATSKLLHEVLPIGHKHSRATIRNHLLRLAERSEKAMGTEQSMFLEGVGPIAIAYPSLMARSRWVWTAESCAPSGENPARKPPISSR